MKKMIFLTATAAMILLGACSQEETKEAPKPVETPPIEEVEVETNLENKVVDNEPVDGVEMEVDYSATTGIVMDENYQSENRFSVMVENSPKSRPHSGLTAADVVYEMEVEYNITRFLAIYNDEVPEKIGPVRSSRHYYVPIASSWNVPYVHFGGSPQAYSAFNTLEIPRIDGIYDGKYFVRDKTRKAPHNAYLVSDNMESTNNEILNNKFVFGEEPYEESTSVDKIKIGYNHFTNVEYRYEAETNRYNRFLEGKPQLDRETGEQISPTNVIVLYAKHEKIAGDDAGRINVDLVSEGEATFLINGKKLEGNWKNEEGEMKFHIEGELVQLRRGKTWIQVVDVSKKEIVTYE